MLIAVAIFGCFIIALGFVGVAAPTALVRFVQSLWATPAGMYWAIGFRLTLGGVLLVAAPESRFPRTLQVLGVASMAAAIAVAALGYLRLAQFAEWWADQPQAVIRALAVVAVLFGAFLVYAAVEGPSGIETPLPGAGSIAPLGPTPYTQPFASGSAALAADPWPMSSFGYVPHQFHYRR